MAADRVHVFSKDLCFVILNRRVRTLNLNSWHHFNRNKPTPSLRLSHLIPMSATVVSAPGKVLLAGGYLILDPKYSGIVVSTSSRFYSVVSPAPTPGVITVNSPQFINAVWKYSVSPDGSIDAEYVTDCRHYRLSD